MENTARDNENRNPVSGECHIIAWINNKIKINNRVMVSTAKATYLMVNLKIQLYHGIKNKSENGHKLITLLLWFWKCVSSQMHAKSFCCEFYGAFNVWNYLSGNRSWSFILNQSETISHQQYKRHKQLNSDTWANWTYVWLGRHCVPCFISLRKSTKLDEWWLCDKYN